MKAKAGIARIVGAALVVLAIVLGVVYLVVMKSFRLTIDEAGERLRSAHTARIAAQVDAYLAQASPVVEGGAAAQELAACEQTPDGLASCLASALLSNPNLTEMTFTHARVVERRDDGSPVVDREAGVWQVSLLRPKGGGDLVVRTVREAAPGRFVAVERPLGGEPSAGTPTDDPSAHATYMTPVSRGFVGRTLWSDLSYSELDSHLPESERRIVLTLMRSVQDPAGWIVGVLRVGLATDVLDERIREASRAEAPHLLFIADDEGRLVSRPEPHSRLYEDEDTSLRVDPGPSHPEITSALALPGLGSMTGVLSGAVEVDGRTWLVSYRAVPASQSWRIGVLVPLDHYMGEFERLRARLATMLGLLLFLTVVFSIFTLRGIQRGFARIHGRIRSMIGFDFAPAPSDAVILEVSETLDGLEQSKTALRAMSRYVPIDLVRQLLASNRDPKLGGTPRTLTMMFTDIESFTSISEAIDRDELADILGRYLAKMTAIMHRHEGTLDKYIGDALMVLWNAPRDVERHESKACEAALEATEMLEALFASPEWSGLPALPTRFGIHTAEVLVGHFGAPDRISYTALGDGVNLASRLEGLNKQYGTRILVSETVARGAAATHELRKVDRVAVKGRAGGVDVFELLGRRGECAAWLPRARAYEAALEDYFARRFDRAGEAFRAMPDEAGAAAMADRCAHFVESPPPADWNGVWVSKEK